MTRLNDFAQLVARAQFNVVEACLMIAEDAYPGLQPAVWLDRFEAIASTVRARCAADAFVEQRLAVLNAHFFGELGFRGNTTEYYDPRNSYLNEVIERRTGIPITLAIVYCELARRLGIPLEGVSFPGHFLVKLRLKRGHLILDPFAAGAPQSEEALRKRLAQVIPAARTAAPASVEPYLEAATPRDIVARVLRNLKTVYTKAGRYNDLLPVMNRLLAVVPEAAEERRDRGLCYARLECFRPAFDDLQEYMRRRPEAPDGLEIHGRMVELRGAVARLN